MLSIKNPHPKIIQAIQILQELGIPKAQQNPRTGLCLLALLNVTPKKKFTQAESPLIGITPILEFCSEYYHLNYAPNSRETFRRFSMHQLVQAGIALYNPDDATRPTNSPHAVYQIADAPLALIKTFKTPKWQKMLSDYQKNHQSLANIYAKHRDMKRIPVTINGKMIGLSAGKHSILIKAIINDFAAIFLNQAELIYIGDTACKSAHSNLELIHELRIPYDKHNKLPDVILFQRDKNWLVVVEAVTSHGPMDAKRHNELETLLHGVLAQKVYITAFPDKATMRKYVSDIAWETEVWIADNPTHLIHFNGSKFLGPY